MNQYFNLKTIVPVVAVLAIGAGIWFYPKESTPAETEVGGQEQQQQSTNVEDLIKKSALEMVNPDQGGTSTVEGAPIDDICVTQQVQTFGCYEDYYTAMVKTHGVKAAFADLKTRYEQNAYIKSQCHPVTHVIGRVSAEIEKDVGIAYTKGDSYCWSGYYHGVMEGVVGDIDRNDLSRQINGICANIPGKASYSFDYYNCVHGLGHGVMAISQNELFESMALCDNIVGDWEQSSCHGGAFMENIIIDNKNHFTKYLKPEEPLYPCTAVNDKYKTTCYLMQTSYMLKVTNSNWSKVFELCSTVGNYAATCYQSLGRDASGQSISNIDSVKTTCGLGKNYDQKSNCIIGAVKDFISYHHSDVQAKNLCAALEASLQPICNSTAESYYTNFRKS